MGEQGQRAGENAVSSGEMSVWAAITSRRNVREFADRPISAGQLEQVLEAGRRSPSSQNSQPWDFVVVTDRDELQQLATVWRGGGHLGGPAPHVPAHPPPHA